MSTDLDVREPRAGLWRDLGRHELVNGFIGFLFSCTGPVAVIISTGSIHRIHQDDRPAAYLRIGEGVVNGDLSQLEVLGVPGRDREPVLHGGCGEQ